MTDGSWGRLKSQTIRWPLGQVLLMGGFVWMVSVAAAGEPTTPPTKPPPPHGGPWQKLFAEQDWYKQSPHQEMIIRGQLKAVSKPEGPSILMRTYYYRLREWNIYTGGQRLRLLDNLVGQEVEILGKEVKMVLEGRELVEFWPGAIRRAMPHPKWSKPPEKPPTAGPTPPPGPVPPAEPIPKEPKPPTEKPTEPVWQKLFADEDWYIQTEAKEQIFRGRLEAVPQQPGMGFLMRASFYRLKDRSIYTGARKLEVLDRLVGKEVEILGKPVDMDLEGRHLREIWPAAIRPISAEPSPAKEPSQPPTQPEKPRPFPPEEKAAPTGAGDRRGNVNFGILGIVVSL